MAICYPVGMLPSVIFEANPHTTPTTRRLPAYIRVETDRLPPLRLTARDRHILEAVHAYDGLLSDKQIQRLFFTGRTAAQDRLKRLFQHGYLNRPTRQQRAALPSMVYWLGEKGAAYIAGLSGQGLDTFTWRKAPRWSQVEHDLAVNDFHLTMVEACRGQPGFALQEWIPGTEFHAHPDKVSYTLPNGATAARYVRPDGFCRIVHGSYSSRLLLELDRASEDNPRLAREKILPGVVYIRSDVYKRRFGYTSGRWLFVTTSERRLHNMKRTTENAVGRDARLFCFTTIDAVSPDTVLAAPIWWRGGAEQPTALFKA